MLISFKAGLANLVDGILTPDPRRGLLRVVEQEDLVHLQWGERRQSGAFQPEIDLVVFPEEAVLLLASPKAQLLHISLAHLENGAVS